MIDLTQDSPKTLTKTASFPKRTVPITTNSSLPDRERLGKLPNPTLPNPNPDSPPATFGSPLTWKRNRTPRHSPVSGFRNDGESRRQDIGMQHPHIAARTKDFLGSVSHEDYKNSRIYTPDYRTYDNHSFRDTKSREDPIPRIVDVRINICSMTLILTRRRL
jgi:hypothetical protein